MIRYLLKTIIVLLFLHSCSPSNTVETLQLEEITIPELQKRFLSGELNSEMVVQAYLKRIEEIDQNGPCLKSVLQINPDAIQIAKELDLERINGNTRGPLHGIPVILKDNIDTNDQMNTTAGSIVMKDSKPLDDAQIVKLLRKSGAIILGKANLSEWANFHSSFSSSGWSALGGQTKNPYDTTRNPCGSSAGSAVAVSANLTMFAIGTETNGSIVCPSNANGIVGIKPTVGLLSRTGIIPISHSQDTPGPMARTVTDAAIALGVMVGVDQKDDKTIEAEGNFVRNYSSFLNKDGLNGKRLGFFTQPMGRHHRVDTLMYQTIRKLKDEGVEIIEIDRIGSRSTGSRSYQVLLYEFKDGLNKYFDSLGDSAVVKNLEDLIEKTFADSVEMRYFDHDLLLQAQEKGDLSEEDYLEALAFMHKSMREDGIDKLMKEHDLDAFVSVTGGPAWKTDHTLGDNFTTSSSSPAAIAGYPNITVPMGFIDHLPIGISFFGTAWSEPQLIEIAYAFEQLTLARRAPNL